MAASAPVRLSTVNALDIIRGLENGQINLGFIRPVENIGSLRFSPIAHERYLLAVAKSNRLAERAEISIDDLRSERIIAFNRKNLSYTERYFNEKFEEYDLTRNIAYSCDDTYSLVSLVSAGLGIGFAPEWTEGLPNRAFELKAVRGIDFRIGLGVAWNKETQPPRATTSSISPGHWDGRPAKRSALQLICDASGVTPPRGSATSASVQTSPCRLRPPRPAPALGPARLAPIHHLRAT